VKRTVFSPARDNRRKFRPICPEIAFSGSHRTQNGHDTVPIFRYLQIVG
jgi:hypothetical protein